MCHCAWLNQFYRSMMKGFSFFSFSLIIYSTLIPYTFIFFAMLRLIMYLYYSSRISNRKCRIAVDKSISRGGKVISLKIRHSVKYCPRYRTYAMIHFDVGFHCPSFAYLTIIVISVYEYVPRYFIKSGYFYHSPNNCFFYIRY